MAWMDRVREGWKWAISTPIGQELAQRARQKADEGVDQILGGQPQEGEKLLNEAEDTAKQAAAAKQSEQPPENKEDRPQGQP